MPYGTTVIATILGLRAALEAGLTPDQVREIGGRQLQRLLAGEEALDLGPPPGDASIRRDLVLGRIHTYLSTAAGRMMIGDDVPDYLGLARLSCEVGEDAPQAEICASILSMLERAEAYAARAEEPTRPPGDQSRPRPPPPVGMPIARA